MRTADGKDTVVLEALKEKGDRRGLGYSVLARQIITEHVNAIHERGKQP